ncbi:MAG: DUF1616 domain-containing protein [Thermoplasmata archaeon]|nr:MAG: DUF1616 domain-containing protein [Thermoplasmata archaeon]
MILEALRIISSLILILFLPGFLFIQALFPKKNELDEDDDLLYRFILSIALSVVISILMGFILGSLGTNPSTGKGYFETFYIVLSLGIFSLLMFSIGLYRGAYPRLSRLFRPETELPITEDEQQQFYNIMDQWRELKSKLDRLDTQIQDAPEKSLKNLKARRARMLKQFNKINMDIKQLSLRSKKDETEAKKLHRLINEWKNFKNELQLCEQRIEISTGDLRERNKETRDKLKKQIEDIEKDITFLRDDKG